VRTANTCEASPWRVLATWLMSLELVEKRRNSLKVQLVDLDERRCRHVEEFHNV